MGRNWCEVWILLWIESRIESYDTLIEFNLDMLLVWGLNFTLFVWFGFNVWGLEVNVFWLRKIISFEGWCGGGEKRRRWNCLQS